MYIYIYRYIYIYSIYVNVLTCLIFEYVLLTRRIDKKENNF